MMAICDYGEGRLGNGIKESDEEVPFTESLRSRLELIGFQMI